MNIPLLDNSPAMQRILAVLARTTDMSAGDLSREAFVGVTTLACGGYLKSLRDQHLVFVSGWRKSKKGFVTPLYSLGNEPDFPRPIFQDSDRASAGMQRIVAALQRFGAMSYREAAQASELSPNTVKNARYMDILVEQRLAHVSGWRRNRNGPMVALYSAGPGEPAKRPAVLTDSEKRSRARARKRALTSDASLVSQLARL